MDDFRNGGFKMEDSKWRMQDVGFKMEESRRMILAMEDSRKIVKDERLKM